MNRIILYAPQTEQASGDSLPRTCRGTAVCHCWPGTLWVQQCSLQRSTAKHRVVA